MKIEILKKDGNYMDLIAELIVNSTDNIGYQIKQQCEFIVSRNGNERLLGLVGVDLGRKLYPEFKHIILRQDASRRIAVKLIKAMENFLRNRGYKEYTAFIRNTRNNLQETAVRLGFTPYASSINNSGVWFYKKITT